MSDELPYDLANYVADVRDLLGLGEWDIEVKLVDSIEDEPSDTQHMTGGDNTYEEPYRIAVIRLVRGFGPERMREHLMHEMVHLAVAPMTRAAQQITMGLVPQRLQSHAFMLLTDGEERAVSALARALVKRGLQ